MHIITPSIFEQRYFFEYMGLTRNITYISVYQSLKELTWNGLYGVTFAPKKNEEPYHDNPERCCNNNYRCNNKEQQDLRKKQLYKRALTQNTGIRDMI